jgi:hypothetical protein
MMAAVKIEARPGRSLLTTCATPIENIYIKRVEKKKLFGYALAEARPAA